MTPIYRTLAGAAALTLLALPGHAQEVEGEEQSLDREQGATPDAESQVEEDFPGFSTFQPTELQRQIFDGPGVTVSGGAEVYDSICAGCHMPDGEGAVGAGEYPGLADNPNLEFPAYAINVIVYGQGAMPAFGDLLSDEQIAAVTNYIRSSFGNDFVSGEAGEATPESVAQIRPEDEVDASSQEEHDIGSEEDE